MQATNPIQRTKDLISSVLEFIYESPWRDLYSGRLTTLKDRADFPCELAIAGRVKAGKSSFLNALLGEDLAMVGTTETTATINFFKYGRPKDAMHPVKVVWENGTEEWQTKAFLDSLQTNNKEVLKKAQEIDHLEYYVDNPILQNITLVDTPGTGALVDEHEQTTNKYLSVEYEQLRKKHNDQSIALKEKADAVVVLTEHVPTASTQELVSRFKDNTSALNSLGVMTKIDTENENAEGWQRRCKEYSSMLRQELNTIVPVSAGVYRYTLKLQAENHLFELQKKLRQIPDEEGMFEEVVGQSTIFLSKDADVTELFSAYGLFYSDRVSMVGDLPWRVFYTIAKELYYHTIDEAVKNLIEYSGMDKVKDILERQFFNRSRIIRCSKIVNEIHSILYEIQNARFYDMRFEVRNRDVYLKMIKNATGDSDIKTALIKLVEKHICTKATYDSLDAKLIEMIKLTESIQQEFSGTDKESEVLFLLEKKSKSFKPKELKELEWLFGKYAYQEPPIEITSVGQRQMFWRAREHQVADNDVKRIISQAIHAYGTIQL